MNCSGSCTTKEVYVPCALQNVDGFLSSSTTYKIVFVSADKDIDYDYAEDIAREMVDDRQESLHFGFVKCTEEEPNTVVLSMLALDSCLTQVVLDMDQSEEGAEAGFASEAMREVSYGFKGKSSVMEFVYSAMDSQHPLSEEAKKVAKHFVREALMGGRKSSESEPLQVYEETVSFVDKSVQSGEMSAHVGEIFLEILEECMESGMVYIADRLNRFNRDGTTTKREELSVQILNVFVEELFGGSK